MNDATQDIDNAGMSVGFRSMISTLAHRWYVILLLTILGGGIVFAYETLFPRQTIYKATAVVQNASPDLSELMYDQDTLNSVAHKLNTTLDSIRQPSIFQRADKTLFNISIQSADPVLAISQANAWADAINYQTHYYITDNANIAIKNAERTVEAAENDLLSYLSQQNLGNLTWSQLEELTGVIPDLNRSETLVSTGVDQLTSTNSILVNVDQKAIIAKLMRAKIAAETGYQTILSESNGILLNIKPKDYYVVSYAVNVETVSQQNKTRDVAIGAVIGLLIGILGLSLVEWWKETGRA